MLEDEQTDFLKKFPQEFVGKFVKDRGFYDKNQQYSLIENIEKIGQLELLDNKSKEEFASQKGIAEQFRKKDPAYVLDIMWVIKNPDEWTSDYLVPEDLMYRLSKNIKK